MKITFIFCVFLFAAISTYLVFIYSKADSFGGGFQRNVRSIAAIRSISVVGLDRPYLAGFKYPKIYVAGQSPADVVNVINVVEGHQPGSRIRIADSADFKRGVVAFQNLFRFDDPGKVIMRTSLTSGGQKEFIDSIPHLDIVPISANSFVTRTFNSEGTEALLAKRDTAGARRYPGILEKQIDGLFCTDGILLYNPDRSLVFYIYYYRNEFICLDTNMNIRYQGNTIDTVTKAKIKVAHARSQGATFLASPHRTVNKHAVSSGEWLIVHSMVEADNDNTNEFKTHAVLDVYKVVDGTYSFSVYLPRPTEAKLKDLAMDHNMLIALFGRHLVIYDISDWLPLPPLDPG